MLANINLNTIIPNHDIIFITLDSLRYDVSQQLFNEGKLPNFSKWLPNAGWEKRYTPASFTYPAHLAFFSGFLPTKIGQQITPRLFASSFEGSESTNKNTFVFKESNFIEALANKGYTTVCIGGVGFFNKKNAIGNVLPGMFQHSEWNEQLGVTEKESTFFQFKTAEKYLNDANPLCLFINISATHQPTHFYLEGKQNDDIETHAAALQYVDSQLSILQERLKTRNTNKLIIVCSDHGTAYGEHDHWGHRNAHETVMTVPYLEYLSKC